MIDLLSLREQDMVDVMKANGFPGFRGKQLFQWIQEKGIKNFDKMGNLPGNLKVWLKDNAVVGTGKIVEAMVSEGGSTVKFLFKFTPRDKKEVYVETVLMCYDRQKTRSRSTVCVSTQSGCAMGCKFCASAIGGLDRSLTAGEIVEQVWQIDNYLKKKNLPPVTNVVFMGMGEPFNNFNEFIRGAEVLNQGKKIGMRRMTVSTSGIVPQILELSRVNNQINLAISLHAPKDQLRTELMPINKRYPLGELMEAIDKYIAATNRMVTIEYALFAGVNDDDGAARELAGLLKGRLVKVNLIKGNPVKETGLDTVDDDRVQGFGAILQKAGIETMLRESRGKDIDGACGQLRRTVINKN